MTYSNGDTMTKKGAEKLAQKIREFYAQQGKDVKVWIEPLTMTDAGRQWQSAYVVRSNIAGQA